MKISYDNFNHLISQGKTPETIKKLIDSPLSEADIMAMSGGSPADDPMRMDPSFQSRYAGWEQAKNMGLAALPAAAAMAASGFLPELRIPGVAPLVNRMVIGPAARAGAAFLGGTAGAMGEQAGTGQPINLPAAARTGAWQGGAQALFDVPLSAAAHGFPAMADAMRLRDKSAAAARVREVLGKAMPQEREMAKVIKDEVQQGLTAATARREAAGQAIAQHIQANAGAAPITFSEYVDQVADIIQDRKGIEYSPGRRRALARDVAVHLADQFNTNSSQLVKLKLPRAPRPVAPSGLLDATGVPVEGPIFTSDGRIVPPARPQRAPLPSWEFDMPQANLGKQIFADAKLAAFEARRQGRALPHAGLNDAMSEAWQKLIEDRIPTIKPLNAEYGAANEVWRRLSKLSNKQPSKIEIGIALERAKQMHAARVEEAAQMAGQQALSTEAPAGVRLRVGHPFGGPLNFLDVKPPALPGMLNAAGKVAGHPITNWSLSTLLHLGAILADKNAQ